MCRMANGERAKPTVHVTTRVDLETATALENLVNETGLSRAGIVAQLLAFAVKNVRLETVTRKELRWGEKQK